MTFLDSKQCDSENHTFSLEAIVLLVLGRCFLIFACYFAQGLSWEFETASECQSLVSPQNSREKHNIFNNCSKIAKIRGCQTLLSKNSTGKNLMRLPAELF
jgi:hypothetical protein